MKRAILVMHYGTPASAEAILPYYTHIRRGRPPTAEQLQDLTDRYAAIGGPSPLTEISHRQAEMIQEGVARRGIDAGLYIGAKHTTPFVADTVSQMTADGVELGVGLVLAPHYSKMSVGTYIDYASKALQTGPSGHDLRFIKRWGTLPALIEGLAARVSAQMEGWDPRETLVIFSAHSLPARILEEGDPYKNELLETSRLVAEAVGGLEWTFAFQSASTTGEPWLGPDVLDVIRDHASRYKNVVCCTVGFVSDHLEVLYDLGIEARDVCAELGLNFRRAATIGPDPAVMDALAALVVERFAL